MVKYAWTLSLIVFFQTISFGQEDLGDSLEIDEVIITQSKIPLSLNRVARPIHVIDNQTIEAYSGKDLSQLLNDQIGIQANGAWSNTGKDKSIFVRGASGEYTLILLDGQPISDPSGLGGTVDVRMLPLDGVESIEIAKGSQSVMYGSDALAGVINIITQKPNEERINVLTRMAYGSFDTYKGAADLRGQRGVFSYGLNGGYQSSNGISEARSQDPSVKYANDGFTQYSFASDFRIDFAEGLLLSAYTRYADFYGDTDEGSFVDAENSYENSSLNTGTQVQFGGDRFQSRLSYNHTRTNRIFDSSFGLSEFFGRFHNMDLFGSYQFTSDLTIVGGINGQVHSMLDMTTTIENPSENILSPYLSLLLSKNDRWNTELGLRVNNHSKFGTNVNYSLASSYWVSSNTKLYANYATGFKTPNLFQLYGAFGANENLNPITSKSFEVGISANNVAGRLEVDFSYFKRDVDQVIIYDFNQGFFNRDNQNDQGIELSVATDISDALSVQVGYTLLDGAISTFNVLGEAIQVDNLYRRPTHSLRANATYKPNNKWLFTGTINTIGERTDLYFNPNNFFTAEEVILDSYIYISASVKYAATDSWEVYFDLNNISNADFSEIYGFTTPGINFMTGVNIKL